MGWLRKSPLGRLALGLLVATSQLTGAYNLDPDSPGTKRLLLLLLLLLLSIQHWCGC
jgi:hypothetical protein